MFDDEYFDGEDKLEYLLSEYEKMKADQPHDFIDEDGFELLVDYLVAEGKNTDAFQACNIGTEQFPFSAGLLLRKGEILADEKKYGQALKVLDQLFSVDPNNLEAILLQSDVLLSQQKFEEVILFLENKIPLFDGQEKTELLLELADVYDEFEEFDAVFYALKRILDYDFRNEEALHKICFWAEFTKKHEESVAIHQRITDEDPYNAIAWFNLGAAFQGMKLYEKAIDAYEYCVAIDERFEYAYRNMGDAYIKLRWYEKAIEVLEKHLEIAKPEDVIFEAIGHCWEKQKDFGRARLYYRKASQLNPEDDEIYYRIGETYAKESQWEKAVKSFSVALHLDKDNATYCMALGNCLMELDVAKEALVCYLNAVRLKPNVKTTWMALVRGLYLAKFYDEAMIQLEIAINNCGEKPEFAYYRAAILMAQGKSKEAMIHLENAYVEGPKKLNCLLNLNPEILQHPMVVDVIARNKKRS